MSDEASHANYYGPVVNMNDGQGNIGINYGAAGAAASQDAELRAAVEELTRLLADLRRHLTPAQDRTVEQALPDLTPDPAALRERGLVLARIAQIAAAVGAVGRPVADAVSRLLDLLG
ncbi:hypothetical protein GCM10010302_51550 [Streptomyces polychromogenes]|uniref:Uncharacterized protein n=1 Tax=Streptomyces polychromogenes TaxID=67342 RepID=A0ABP3F8Q3_9ACTN